MRVKSRESRSRNFQADSYKCRKDCGCSKVTFSILPQYASKMEENCKKTAQNEPKLRESCAPWQKLHACTKTRKLHKSCAAQHRNFLGGLSNATRGCCVPTPTQHAIPTGSVSESLRLLHHLAMKQIGTCLQHKSLTSQQPCTAQNTHQRKD